MRIAFILLSAVLLLSACTEIIESEGLNIQSDDLGDYEFPEDFEFVTQKEIMVSLGQTTNPGKYIIAYDWGQYEERLASFDASKGVEGHRLVIPDALDAVRVYLVTQDRTVSQSIDLNLTNSIDITLEASNSRTAENCRDRLYAVESSFGGFWDIDLTAGNYDETPLANLMGGGSIACTLDQENSDVYYNVGQTLYRYRLNDATFEAVFTSNPFNGNYPRLAFKDGFFYMSNGTRMYKVNASTNEVVSRYTISGFVNSASGGDIDFASDGTLYMACFSGLYRFTTLDDAAGTATIERLSAENFPYQLTSMAIDRNDDIYVGTNEGNSKLIRMSIQDGSFEIVKTYDHKINDLTAWRCEESELGEEDTDGDGIIDPLDEFPDDPEVAFVQYTPSELGNGTLAFEDNWPQLGDYDFNDLVIRYRYIYLLNADNKMVRAQLQFTLTAMGAILRNGFGIQLPIDKAKIKAVTGFQLTRGWVELDEKGLERNQSKPVMIVFDNAFDHMEGKPLVNTEEGGNTAPTKNITLEITFNEPVSASSMLTSQFNPFIFLDGDRSKEVHLLNRTPTDLMNLSLLGTGDDVSEIETGKYYGSVNGAPWGIDIIHEFRYPKEKISIDRGYNRFLDWADSDATNHKDWYTDASGNRNVGNLYNQ